MRSEKMTRAIVLTTIFIVACQFGSAASAQSAAQQIIDKTQRNLPLRISLFSTEIKNSPKVAEFYLFRGGSYAYSGKYEEAENDLRKAVKLAPTDHRTRSELAWYLATVEDAGKRDAIEAVDHALKAVQLSDYKNAIDLKVLGTAYASKGQFGLAKTYMRAAIQLGLGHLEPSALDHLELFKSEKSVGNGFAVVGEVFYENKTSTDVQIVDAYSVAKDGSKSEKGVWNIPANSSGFLTTNGQRHVAKDFWYRIKSSDGLTPEGSIKMWRSWHFVGEKLRIKITRDKLPARRVIAAKPVIRDPLVPDGIKDGIATVKEIAETANDVVETYNEIKKLFPKKDK